MALTAEDVVNKRFQPTKFREGYDQDEVDDFLDEVVVEFRRLTQENEQLKQSLSASEEKVAQLERDGATAAPVEAAAPAPAAEPEPVSAAVPVAAPVPAASPSSDETADTNNLLQLARRLHEEHVREGKEKRDALIAEGHAAAAQIVAEAEEKQRAQISSLDKEKEALEKQIGDLRNFERDYRKSLKDYIQGQLTELENSQGPSSSSTPSATGSTPTGSTTSPEGSSAPFSGLGG